ncbi:hypothetical protein JYU34_019014 [Plutella xylostella]|uniref:CLIP domain-containing serine protease n=1 Tax=Plutella xylostella TaxID=51655 RepID=A0ABQ7Q2T1_PLUXY|nr:hypothetical protein JYU34_019014 [Plutella xylostella]
MFLRRTVVLLSLVLLNCDNLFGQSCNDCITVTDCQEAVEMVNQNDAAATALLRRAFCGFGARRPKVCCSALQAKLDSHPNLSLLPENCGFIDGDRLIGGMKAGLYQFPWMALISHSTRSGLKFQCGGTLINDRYVLTAAHCMKNLQIAGVRIGEYDYRTETDCVGEPPKVECESKIQDIRVEEAILHPAYSGRPGPVLNDIGLLRLSKKVDFTPKNAKPICLPISSSLRQRALAGENATLAGWGFTEEHLPSPVLMTVNVPVHTPEDCRFSYHKGKLSESQPDLTVNKLCAGEKGKDSCSGDSGGPLMVAGLHSGKSRYIQYGVVSTGPRNCGSGAAGYYTDVSKYMQWILDTIKP